MTRAELLRRLGRNKKRIILFGIAVLLLLCAVISLCLLGNVKNCLITQSAAPRWRGESEVRFSQVSAFLPQDAVFDLQSVYSLRQNLSQTFVAESMEVPEGGSLSHDAFYGFDSVTIFNDRASITAKAIGVGGDFFFFHPLTLLSGSYISESDFMHDGVVLDEDLAWTLFGSFDIAGQSVQIGTHRFYVAGVVKREDDFATKAAYQDGAGLFMDYEMLNALSETKISGYEVVMPNPVVNYAKNMIAEKIGIETADVVENTDRFSAARLFSVIGSFAKRSMNTSGIIYPYWENAARYCEDYAALLQLLFLLFLLLPVILAVWQIVWLIRKYVREGSGLLHTKLEEYIENRKKKHYKREGL